MVRMINLIVLLYTHITVFKNQNTSLIRIVVTVVRSRKQCYDIWKTGWTVPTMHFIAFNLNLVSSYNTHQIVGLQDFSAWLLTKNKRAFSLFIINIVNSSSLLVITRV